MRLADTITERQLQAAIVDAVRLNRNWLPPYHTLNSRGSEHGWPDLALVGHPERAFAGRLAFLELKDQRRGRLTPEQALYLEGLRVAGAVAETIRPRDLEWVLEFVRTAGLPAPPTAHLAEAAHGDAGTRTVAG